MNTQQEAIDQMNLWGGQQKPFLFIIDFELIKPQLYLLKDIPDNISFDLNGVRNIDFQINDTSSFLFESKPVRFETYKNAFDQVVEELKYGNSYLLNLTFPTLLDTNLNLKSIFNRSKARYKLLVDSNFVVFSPEPFIKIDNGIISSYPMKGTIDSALPNAEKLLLSNSKEQAEHATIVDLIRNDLSKIATHVKVIDYRYIEKVKTFKKTLLQVSSKIEGKLPANYKEKLGNIIFSLLPAGSISGAPKTKTLEIIKKAEQMPRNYFTGVFGIFDGNNLDSGVMIRFIEQINGKFVYRSGGGITAQSDALNEYKELLDKVYVPFN